MKAGSRRPFDFKRINRAALADLPALLRGWFWDCGMDRSFRHLGVVGLACGQGFAFIFSFS
jgi:hypothetical protein